MADNSTSDSKKKDVPASEEDTQLLERLTETHKLQSALYDRTMECDAFKKRLEEITVKHEAELRDFSAKKVELEAGVRKLTATCEEHRQQIEELRSRNEQLASDNRALQERLESAEAARAPAPEDAPEAADTAGEAFFPQLAPLKSSAPLDPVVLDGDLATFFLPDLLGFLERSGGTGVLTVETEECATKLYLEEGVLRMAAWNDRSPELSLTTLLVESELLSRDELAEIVEESAYDFEVARTLLATGALDVATVQACLREHAKVVLSRLFEVKAGRFYFQPGRVDCAEDLQFQLRLTNFLLKTAAHFDENARGA